MNSTQKPIRTNTVRFLKQHGISVARFREMSKRTRLNTESNLLKIQQHILLWDKYNWL